MAHQSRACKPARSLCVLMVIFLSYAGMVAPVNLGILVPAYFNIKTNRGDFDRLVPSAEALGHRLVAVFNPNNGPVPVGHDLYYDYLNYMNRVRTAGGKVIAYVYTQLGTRSKGLVLSDIDSWYNDYQLEGIFFDETSPDSKDVPIYQEYVDHVRIAAARTGQPSPMIVLNPGVAKSDGKGYLDVGDIIIVKEDYERMYATYEPQGWTLEAEPDQVCFLAHQSKDWRCVLASAQASNAKWIYSTDYEVGGNPWAGLPSFWEDMVHAVGTQSEFSGICGSSPEAASDSPLALYSIYPQEGSIYGGTRVTMSGARLDELQSDGVQMSGISCVLNRFTTTFQLGQCITAAPPQGTLQGLVTSAEITSDKGVVHECPDPSNCLFTFSLAHTPLITGSAWTVPGYGGVVQISGSFLSTDETRVRQIWVGDWACSVSGVVDYGGKPSIESFKIESSGRDHTLKCIVGSSPGLHTVGMQMDVGVAGVQPTARMISPTIGTYSILVSPIVQQITPSSGSQMGGGVVTLSGHGLGGLEVGSRSAVYIGNNHCTVLSSDSDFITCRIEEGDHASAPYYSGGLGMEQDLYGGVTATTVQELEASGVLSGKADSTRLLVEGKWTCAAGTACIVRGHFSAPYTGNYTFMLSTGGPSRLEMHGSPDPSSPVVALMDLASGLLPGDYGNSTIAMSINAGEVRYFKITHLGGSNPHGHLGAVTDSIIPYTSQDSSQVVHERQRITLLASGGDHIHEVSWSKAEVGSFSLQWMDGPIVSMPANIGSSADFKNILDKTLGTVCSFSGGLPAYLKHTFESNADAWGIWNHNFVPELSNESSFCGRQAMRLRAGWAVVFQAEGAAGYDLAEYPFVCMATKLPPGGLATMLIHAISVGWLAVKVTETEGLPDESYAYRVVGDWSVGSAYFGTSPMETDNAWHYRCIDLRAQVTASLGPGTPIRIDSIIFHSPSMAYSPAYSSSAPFLIDEFAVTATERVLSSRNSDQMSVVAVDTIEVTDKSDATMWKFLISIRPRSCEYEFLDVLTSDRPSDMNATAISGIGEPLEGTYVIGSEGDLSSAIHMDARANELEAIIKSVTGSSVKVTLGESTTCMKQSFEYEFLSAGSRRLLDIDSSGLKGSNVSAFAESMVKGGVWLSPIPGEFLATVQSIPTAHVTINNARSICTGNCSYAFVGPPPEVELASVHTPSSIVSPGDVVTLSGSNLVWPPLGNPNVMIGDVDCPLLSTSNSSITCSAPMLSLGLHPVRVLYNNFGQVNSTVPFNVLAGLSVISSSPSNVGTRGGAVLSIVGIGFPGDESAVSVTVGGSLSGTTVTGGVGCNILTSNTTNLECETLPYSSGTHSIFVVVAGEIPTAVELASAVVYDPSLDMVITSISPLSGNAIDDPLVTVRGSGFSNNAMFVVQGLSGVCILTLRSFNEIKCRMQGLKPGAHQVRLEDPLGPGNSNIVNYTSVLHLSSVVPNHGSLAGGDLITILGQGFGTEKSENVVSIGDSSCDIEAMDDRSIVCRTSKVAGTAEISSSHLRGWAPLNITIAAGMLVKWSWKIPPFLNKQRNVVVRSKPDGAVVARSSTGSTGSMSLLLKQGVYEYTSEPDHDRLGLTGWVTVEVPSTVNPSRAAVVTRGISALHNGTNPVSFPACVNTPDPHGVFYARSPCSSAIVTQVSPSVCTSGGNLTLRGVAFNAVAPEDVSVQLVGYDETKQPVSVPCVVISTSTTSINCTVSRLTPPGFFTVMANFSCSGNALFDTSPSISVVPDITSVSPATGSMLGGTAVTISGRNLNPSFLGTMSVLVGSSPCRILSSTPESVVCKTERPHDYGYSSTVQAHAPAVYLSFNGYGPGGFVSGGESAGSVVGSAKSVHMESGIPTDTRVRFDGDDSLSFTQTHVEPLLNSEFTLEFWGLQSSPATANTRQVVFAQEGTFLVTLSSCNFWEAWVKTQETSSGLCDPSGCSACQGSVYSNGTWGIPEGYWLRASGAVSSSSIGVLDHVIVTVSRPTRTVQLFINGALIAAVVAGSQFVISNPVSPGSVGYMSDAAAELGLKGFTGFLDEVAIYETLLDVPTISQHYRAALDRVAVVLFRVKSTLIEWGHAETGIMGGEPTSGRDSFLYASCNGDLLDRSACAISLSKDATVVVQDISPSTGPVGSNVYVNLTVPDDLSPSDVYISVGDEPCNTTTFSQTSNNSWSFSCEIPHLPVGPSAVGVTSALGRALFNVTSNITAVDFDPVIEGSFDFQVAGYLSSVSPSLGSLSGGTSVTLRGEGFTANIKANIVRIGDSECDVTEATFDRVVCTTRSHKSSTFSVVTVQVGSSTLKRSPDNCCPFSYSTLATPQVTPATVVAYSGLPLTLAGLAFSSVSSEMRVELIGRGLVTHDCPVVSSTSTEISCIFPHIPAGKYDARVHRHGLGRALGEVTIEKRIEVSSALPSTVGYGGGQVLTLSGKGFPEFSPELLQSSALLKRVPADTTWSMLAWGWKNGGEDTLPGQKLVDVDLKTSADDIAALKADGHIVVCYFSVGTSEVFREDYRENEALWKSVEVGKMADWDEQWINIKELDVLKSLLQPRFDHAAKIGCDGVEPDNVDCYQVPECFRPILGNPGASQADGVASLKGYQVAFNKWQVDYSHSLGMIIGLKNALDLIPDTVDDYDFAVNEQCQQYNECHRYLPFTERDKLVLNTEYIYDTSYCGTEYGGAKIMGKYCDGNGGICLKGKWISCFEPFDSMPPTEYDLSSGGGKTPLYIEACGDAMVCKLINTTSTGLTCELDCYKNTDGRCLSGTGETCDLSVTLYGASTVIPGALHIAADHTPIVTGVSPIRGKTGGGTTVTIFGSKFPTDGAASLVAHLGNSPCGVTASTATTITCVSSVTTTPGPVDVRVERVGYGDATVDEGVTYTYVDFWSDTSYPDGANVTLGKDSHMVLDGSTARLDVLTVHGILEVSEHVDISVYVNELVIDGGCMKIGSQATPYERRAEIVLGGSDSSLSVLNGDMLFFGKVSGPSWTMLAAPAPAGSTAVSVLEAVSWTAGDEIVLSPTGYKPSEAEVAVVASVSGDGLIVTLASALQYHHEGTTVSLGSSSHAEHRAEVGLLSRHIIIRGESTKRGGRLLVTKDSSLQLSGVEFQNVGDKSATEISAAVNFLGVDSESTSFIRHSSIRNTQSSALVADKVSQLNLEDNVMYDIQGSAIFISGALDRGLEIHRNMIVKITYGLSSSDADRKVCGVYVRNPHNSIVGNHVGGSDFNGLCVDVAKESVDSAGDQWCPSGIPIKKIEGNVLHTALNGGMVITGNLAPRLGWHGCWGKLDTSTISRTVSYHCRVGVLADHIGHVRFENTIVAGNTAAGISIGEMNPDVHWGGAVVYGSTISARLDASDEPTREGVVIPRDDGFLMEKSALLGFNSSGQAIPLALDRKSIRKGWGHTAMFRQMTIENTVRLVEWQQCHEAIFADLDGTLTAQGGGQTLLAWSNLLPPTCTRIPASSGLDGATCPYDVVLRGMLVTMLTPLSNKGIVLSNSYGNSKALGVAVDSIVTNYAVVVVGEDMDMDYEGESVAIDSYRVELKDMKPTDHMVVTTHLASPIPFTVDVNNENMFTQKPLSPMMPHGTSSYNSGNQSVSVLMSGSGLQSESSPFSGYPERVPHLLTVYSRRNSRILETMAPYGFVANETLAWSSPLLWQAPQDGDSLVIHSKMRLLVDTLSTSKLRKVVVHGLLEFVETGETVGFNTEILEVAPGGRIVAGQPNAPFVNGDVEVTLTAGGSSTLSNGRTVPAGSLLVDGSVSLVGQARSTYVTDLRHSIVAGETTLRTRPGIDWKEGDIIMVTSSSFDPAHTEVRRVTSTALLTSDTIVFVDAPFSAHHSNFNGPDSLLASRVHLLSRNIAIKGDGGSQIISTRLGNIIFSDLEIDGFGLPNVPSSFPHHGLVFNDQLAGPADSVSRCTMRNGVGPAVFVPASVRPGLVISKNVIHRPIRTGFEVLGGATVASNTVAMVLSGASQTAVVPSGFLLTSDDAFMIDNIVSGSEDTGYWVRGSPCNNSPVLGRTFNNHVSAAMVGVRVEGNETMSCVHVRGYSVAKTWGAGVYGHIRSDIVIDLMKMIDNNIAINANIFSPRSLNHGASSLRQVSIHDSIIYGSADGSSDACMHASPPGVLPASYPAIVSHRVGIMTPSFTSTKAPNIFIASPPDDLSLIYGQTVVRNVTFSHFGGSVCGRQRDYAVSTNMHHPGSTQELRMSSISTTFVSTASLVSFASPPRLPARRHCGAGLCDAMRHMAIHDSDGSFLRCGGASCTAFMDLQFPLEKLPKTALKKPGGIAVTVNKLGIPRTPPNIVGNCTVVPEWGPGIQCAGALDHRMISIEGRDAGSRHPDSAGTVALVTEDGQYMDLLFGSQSLTPPVARYVGDVINNERTEVHIGTKHRNLRFRLLRDDGAGGVVISLRFRGSPWLHVYGGDGNIIPPMNAHLMPHSATPGPHDVISRYDTGAIMPSVSDPHGTSMYDFAQQALHITLRGSAAVEVVQVPTIASSIHLKIGTAEFVEQHFTMDVASKLGIDAGRIRVMDIRPSAQSQNILAPSRTGLRPMAATGESSEVIFLIEAESPPPPPHNVSEFRTYTSRSDANGFDLGDVTSDNEDQQVAAYNALAHFHDAMLDCLVELDRVTTTLADLLQRSDGRKLNGTDIDGLKPIKVVPASRPPEPARPARGSGLAPISTYERPFVAQDGEALTMAVPQALSFNTAPAPSSVVGDTIVLRLEMLDAASTRVTTLGLGTKWSAWAELRHATETLGNASPSLRAVERSVGVRSMNNYGDTNVVAPLSATAEFADGIAEITLSPSETGSYYVYVETSAGFSTSSSVFTVESKPSDDTVIIVASTLSAAFVGFVVFLISTCLTCICLWTILACALALCVGCTGLDGARKMAEGWCMIGTIISALRTLLGIVPHASSHVYRSSVVEIRPDEPVSSEEEGTPMLGSTGRGAAARGLPRRIKRPSLFERVKERFAPAARNDGRGGHRRVFSMNFDLDKKADGEMTDLVRLMESDGRSGIDQWDLFQGTIDQDDHESDGIECIELETLSECNGDIVLEIETDAAGNIVESTPLVSRPPSRSKFVRKLSPKQVKASDSGSSPEPSGLSPQSDGNGKSLPSRRKIRTDTPLYLSQIRKAKREASQRPRSTRSTEERPVSSSSSMITRQSTLKSKLRMGAQGIPMKKAHPSALSVPEEEFDLELSDSGSDASFETCSPMRAPGDLSGLLPTDADYKPPSRRGRVRHGMVPPPPGMDIASGKLPWEVGNAGHVSATGARRLSLQLTQLRRASAAQVHPLVVPESLQSKSMARALKKPGAHAIIQRPPEREPAQSTMTGRPGRQDSNRGDALALVQAPVSISSVPRPPASSRRAPQQNLRPAPPLLRSSSPRQEHRRGSIAKSERQVSHDSEGTERRRNSIAKPPIPSAPRPGNGSFLQLTDKVREMRFAAPSSSSARAGRRMSAVSGRIESGQDASSNIAHAPTRTAVAGRRASIAVSSLKNTDVKVAPVADASDLMKRLQNRVNKIEDHLHAGRIHDPSQK